MVKTESIYIRPAEVND